MTEPPEADRPTTEDSDGIPVHRDGLLDRAVDAEAMRTDRQFWVGTVRPDGVPRRRPTWGVWLDDTFHCRGGARTRGGSALSTAVRGSSSAATTRRRWCSWRAGRRR